MSKLIQHSMLTRFWSYYLRRSSKVIPGRMCEKVFVHHDAASSHTARFTTAYATQLKANLGITIIPVRASDSSQMDFFGFGYLKQKDSKETSYDSWGGLETTETRVGRSNSPKCATRYLLHGNEDCARSVQRVDYTWSKRKTFIAVPYVIFSILK